MRYVVHSASPLDQPDANWDHPRWAAAATLEVGDYAWEDSGHHPLTSARMLYDDRVLAVIFRVEDHYVRAVAEKFQDSVCLDSCAEFFVAPVPGSDGYFNFEVNCGGTMLVHRCAAPQEKAAGLQTYDMSQEDGATIAMAHSMPRIVEPEIARPTTWTIEYHVPFTLFAKYFDAPPAAAGTVWRGNFYKCGDATSHPHWGSWAPVDGPRPSFHQPAFFQPIEFA
jgi:hypothetical protein